MVYTLLCWYFPTWNSSVSFAFRIADAFKHLLSDPAFMAGFERSRRQAESTIRKHKDILDAVKVTGFARGYSALDIVGERIEADEFIKQSWVSCEIVIHGAISSIKSRQPRPIGQIRGGIRLGVTLNRRVIRWRWLD